MLILTCTDLHIVIKGGEHEAVQYVVVVVVVDVDEPFQL